MLNFQGAVHQDSVLLTHAPPLGWVSFPRKTWVSFNYKSIRDERFRLVLLTWDYKTQLLLPAQAGKESLSCCSPGESRSAASRSCEGRTFKPRWTGGGTGSNHHPQWMFDPCDRNHSYGPPFKRDRGDTECSMTPPALRRSTSSAATPICAPVWTVWLH